MEKSKLKLVENIRFPRKIQLDILAQADKIEYIYAARKITSGHKSILEVDFFSLKEKTIAFRVFLSNKDFVTEILTPEHMWSNSQIDKMVSLFYYNKGESLVALNERSNRAIVSFLTPKLKGYAPSEPPTPLQMILSFQLIVRKSMLEKKHQKIKDRIDSELANMEKIPKDINDWIEKYPLWHNQYIFYKRKGKKYTGYCSACKSTVFPEYAKHKLGGICPSCGCPVTFKADGRSKNTYDKFIFSYIQKGIGDCIIQRVFEGYKSYRNGFDKPDVKYSEERRYVYRDGKYKAYHRGNFKNTGDYRWCDGFPHKQMGYYTFTDRGSVYANNIRETFKDTEWIDCRLEKFADTKTPFDVMDYFALYRKQPEIRFLVDNGLYSLIFEIINMSAYAGLPSIKKETFDILNDKKAFFPLFRKIGILPNELELISHFPSDKFIKEDILLRIRESGLTKEFAPVFKYTTPIKALNYLAKQSKSGQPCKDDLILWLDYLTVAGFLDYNMASSFVVFPCKLKKEHDRINDEYGTIACLQGDEKIALIADKVNALFAYENDKFLIRAPIHGKEIKDEGAALRHCVGSYVKDMATLKTFILFVRDKKDCKKSFYTVEYKNSDIRQCHGYDHSSATPEVQAFLDEWKKQLYKKGQKTLAAAA